MWRVGSHVFCHGLAGGETNKVNIADGKMYMPVEERVIIW